MESEYNLFMHKSFKGIRKKFSLQTRSDFIRLYALGYSHAYICEELKLKETEFMLISIDLNHSGLLPVRKNGIRGTK